MPKHILFISSWYPTETKKSHGIFFQRHAEAAALINNISSIYVHAAGQSNVDAQTINGVFTITGTYNKVQHQIPIIAAFQKFWRALLCFKKCYRTLISNKSVPNLVMLNVVFPAGIFALWLYYFRNISFLIQEQWSGYYPEDGNYKGFFTKFITKLCVNKAKAVLVVSNKLESSMKNHGLYNKYLRIGNVVDTDLFVPSSNKSKIPFKFVHVSTVNNKEKNITGIIEAAKILVINNTAFQIDIVGYGPELKHFEALAKSYNLLNKNIFFHGFQLPEQVAKIMAQAHCFILNSNYEGLPCVLLEAMSCGIPVIATKVGAVPEIINQEQGILIDVNNQMQLSQTMCEIMSSYEKFNAVAIRENVIRKFSYPAIAKDFDAIFTSTLNL